MNLFTVKWDFSGWGQSVSGLVDTLFPTDLLPLLSSGALFETKLQNELWWWKRRLHKKRSTKFVLLCAQRDKVTLHRDNFAPHCLIAHDTNLSHYSFIQSFPSKIKHSLKQKLHYATQQQISNCMLMKYLIVDLPIFFKSCQVISV